MGTSKKRMSIPRLVRSQLHKGQLQYYFLSRLLLLDCSIAAPASPSRRNFTELWGRDISTSFPSWSFILYRPCRGWYRTNFPWSPRRSIQEEWEEIPRKETTATEYRDHTEEPNIWWRMQDHRAEACSATRKRHARIRPCVAHVIRSKSNSHHGDQHLDPRTSTSVRDSSADIRLWVFMQLHF